MPAIDRKTQQIFGGSLVPAGNLAVWGSLQAGAPAFSSDPDVIQSLANFLSGFNGAVVGNRSPTMEDMNGLMFLVTRQLAYILAAGIPEYDAATTYFTNHFCRVGPDLYVSLSDNNAGNDPTTSTNDWQPYRDRIAPAQAVPKAWVNFNGTTGTRLASYNVASVVRTAAGTYTIAFGTPMVNTNYAVLVTCGPANGGSRSNPPGNNNHGCRDVITAVGQCSVWLPKPDLLVGEDADVVSVVIFGD